MSNTLWGRAEVLLPCIPGPITAKWPGGERFRVAFSHGSMSVELYAPEGVDTQSPHDQDEIYIIQSGKAMLQVGDESFACAPGFVCFVPAYMAHCFSSFSPDFTTWVIFWGPPGGEAGSSTAL